MRIMKWLLISCVAGSLIACGLGFGNSSSGVVGGFVGISPIGNSELTINGTYNGDGCYTITANGSCQISLTYAATGTTLNNQRLSLSGLNGYTVSGMSSCPSIANNQNSCNITITNNDPSVVSIPQDAEFIAMEQYLYTAFRVGGGLYNNNPGRTWDDGFVHNNYLLQIGQSSMLLNGYYLDGKNHCHNILANGICQISLQYYNVSGTKLLNQQLSLSGLTGYTSNISECSTISSQPQVCVITITNTDPSVINQTQNITLMVESESTLQNFYVGGPNNN